MKYSWNWIGEYVDLSDLDKNELAELLVVRALEVDEVTDEYIDIDVTPNRASDCLSHWGVARELGAILNREVKKPWSAVEASQYESDLLDSEFVNQFSVLRIENVQVEPSPEIIQKRLEVLGLKPINLLVDLTNYVMLELGQPLHAYDADKLPSDLLGARAAQADEEIDLLDGKTHSLSETNYVIVDSKNTPLGLAGVKGGASSQVDEQTKSILVEAANFNQVKTRRSAAVSGIRTDAVKRFENGLAVEWAEIALGRYLELLKQYQPQVIATTGIKSQQPNFKKTQTQVRLELEQVNSILGLKLTWADIKEQLQRLDVKIQDGENDKSLFATAPFYRLDLNIAQEYIEEIGRLFGYENIQLQSLPTKTTKPSPYDLFTALRQALLDFGLFEVQTYSLVKKGDIETVKPLASDKGALRTNLAKQLAESLQLNVRNAELFGLDQVGIFEIGSVFPKAGEAKHLAIALSGKVKNLNHTFSQLKDILSAIDEKLVSDWQLQEIPGGMVVELKIDEIELPAKQEVAKSKPVKFQEFSKFPFIVRDLSTWVFRGGSQTEIEEIITAKAKTKGDATLHSFRLTDQFSKDGRDSFTYRLVFQSPERTLTDEEVNEIMDKIYSQLQEKSVYEIR